MMTKYVWYLIVCLMMMCPSLAMGQEMQSELDSMRAVNDSVVQELRHQIQELKLQGIMMQEQLEVTGKSAREDSLRQVERKHRVDSLRNVTPGAALVIERDTLLVIMLGRVACHGGNT